MIWRIAIVAVLLAQVPAWGQSAGVRKVFPLFVDGIADGLVYRSELKIINKNAVDPSLRCTLTQRNTSGSFVGINGDRYYADVFDSGDSPPATTTVALDRFLPWEVLRSVASSPLRTGYASLDCPSDFHTELLLSLTDLKGNKLGETTVLPGVAGNSFQFLLDRRNGTRLGVALVNDSAAEGEYIVIATDEFHQEINRYYGTIGAWSHVAHFVDELMVLPPNSVESIEVVGLPGGHNYAVGLQYTGPVFATVSPLVR